MQGSYNGCSYCSGFLQGALEASGLYFDLLRALEAAHIRNDTEITYHLQEEVGEALLGRDKAITGLCDHPADSRKGRSRRIIPQSTPLPFVQTVVGSRKELT